MPTYVFKGRNRMNEVVMGERVADDRDALRQVLRREQVTLTSVKEKGREIGIPKLAGRKKVKSKDLAIFTRQFSVMIDAGLPLVQCLDILAQQQQNKYFQQVLAQVRQEVEAGETGGILDLILQRLSTFIEKIVKLKRDVISALIYPAAVILLAVVAVCVIMIVVIPQFQTIFLGLLGPGEPLPLPTRIVVGISNFLAGWGGLSMLVLVIGTVVALRFYYKTAGGRKRIDTLLLKVPIIGPIFLKIAVARFSRTLSTLLSSGVPILQSLDITARTAGNMVIEEAIISIRAGVEQGKSFVEPLRTADIFPHMVAQMIGIGEQTGALDAMLGKIADFYEQEVDAAIANLLTLIEPALIGFLGVTIGSIVVSMYLPMFTLIGKLSQGH